MWVPDAGAEALRDLVRTRQAAKQDQLRARHRLSKFLLRTGRRPPLAGKAWTLPYMAIGPVLRTRQEGVPEEIKEMAWKAQLRLHKRYARLAAAGKDPRKIVTAVGRELLGFIWAIGRRAEAAAPLARAA